MSVCVCVCVCESLCVSGIIHFTCNILIMLSMFQRFMLGNNGRIFEGKKRSWTPKAAAVARPPSKTFTHGWLVWHITKEEFLISHKFPSKIIWLYNTVCKAQANRNSRGKVFISNEHFASNFGGAKSFLPFLFYLYPARLIQPPLHPVLCKI